MRKFRYFLHSLFIHSLIKCGKLLNAVFYNLFLIGGFRFCHPERNEMESRDPLPFYRGSTDPSALPLTGASLRMTAAFHCQLSTVNCPYRHELILAVISRILFCIWELLPLSATSTFRMAYSTEE